ncbi:aspartate kinase [Paenibacillus eucommiae]|uniref:Aspartokinase n=1 Tax=Paenibacillus eucommiae TaxID=1355755 RepID=A0ABS4IUM3_9BACL|nr:aspartate kinase [Paenibacillus eucommiae]MBP1991280.1 aspartate kinase [Paenibacillus eucommiae]
MRILVQKFGGTSLSTAEAREHVFAHIRDALAEPFKLVVVVSAMGRKGDPYATDTLLELTRLYGGSVSSRELDLLLCCGEVIAAVQLCSLLQARGISAVVLTGGQAGIQTNENFGSAQILKVQPSRIMQHLEQEQVVIVTGFQGKTLHDDFTTLGRGGSDTSATALGAALKAEMVDIFTDVNGILTADPRIVEDARPLTRVSFSEICNMAHNGAKVIHPRAVEIAMQANIPIRVRSTFSKSEGTLVTHIEGSKMMLNEVEDRRVTGIAHFTNITQIQVSAPRGEFDLQLQVFKTMAEHKISVDFINVNPSAVVYTVFDHEAEHAVGLLQARGYEPLIHGGCAKVSIIGGGMNGVPGIMAHIVEALTDEDIRILQSADSNTTIWVLVHGEDMQRAVRALHHKFQLNK